MIALDLVADLADVHVTFLEGLGASYRIRGFFGLANSTGEETKVNFEAVAFGGNYGGHNLSVSISEEERSALKAQKNCSDLDIEELITEVQRKMLNNDMVVEYDKLQPAEDNSLGPLGP